MDNAPPASLTFRNHHCYKKNIEASTVHHQPIPFFETAADGTPNSSHWFSHLAFPSLQKKLATTNMKTFMPYLILYVHKMDIPIKLYSEETLGYEFCTLQSYQMVPTGSSRYSALGPFPKVMRDPEATRTDFLVAYRSLENRCKNLS